MPLNDYYVYHDQQPGWEDTVWRFKKGSYTGDDVDASAGLVHVTLDYNMQLDIGEVFESEASLENFNGYYRGQEHNSGKFAGYLQYNSPTTDYANVALGAWYNNSGSVSDCYFDLNSALTGIVTDTDGETKDLSVDITGVRAGVIGFAIAPAKSHPMCRKNRSNVVNIEADFPIFKNKDALDAYILTGDLSGCINLSDQYDLDTSTFWIYCHKKQGTLLRGKMTPDDAAGTWISQKFMANKEPVLYFVRDGSFELSLIASGIVASKYVSQPGYTIDYLPEESWTDYSLEYDGNYWGTLPDYQIAKGKVPKDGTYYYGYEFQTNIHIFKNRADAEEAIETGDYSKAINEYDLQEGNTHRPVVTGQGETSTTFGDGTVTSPFVAMYLLDRTEVLNIANVFYTDDQTLLDNIKEGLSLFGAQPYESLVSLTWYPFNVGNICQAVSQPYIYFGSYKYDQVTADRVWSLAGSTSSYVDAGTVSIDALFDSYRDFSPYTELSVWLPYHGWEKLEIAKYLNKTVNIRYYVDIATATYVIAMVADNLIVDEFSGNIGVTLPVCGNNQSQYANDMIKSVMGAAGGVVGGAMGGAMVGSALPGIGTAAGAVAGGVIGGAAGIAKGVFEMSQKPKPRDLAVVRGAFSAGAASYMPQYVIFRYDIHQLIVPDNLTELYGRPSSAGGAVSSFNGFLKVNTVKLNTYMITDSEIAETTQLLQSGIFVS